MTAGAHESFGRMTGVGTYLNMVDADPLLKDQPVQALARKAALLAIEQSSLLEVKRLNKTAVAREIFQGITDYTFNQFSSELSFRNETD